MGWAILFNKSAFLWENPKTDLWFQIIWILHKQKIAKFLYLNRAPNIHYVRSAGDLKNMAESLFFITEEVLDPNRPLS